MDHRDASTEKPKLWQDTVFGWCFPQGASRECAVSEATPASYPRLYCAVTVFDRSLSAPQDRCHSYATSVLPSPGESCGVLRSMTQQAAGQAARRRRARISWERSESGKLNAQGVLDGVTAYTDYTGPKLWVWTCWWG
ncbi:hypothetical protein AAFF_G00164180 [Aldrovandia affinis]|uniref:Uncharacterized protein n=1 Tax=Aldrovandia affinis TaxID=143900 RepID=A0AAD7SZR0_9TELE|nr:hypothetical protein AAFF_G00164180 [Aldrovandia affinis]